AASASERARVARRGEMMQQDCGSGGHVEAVKPVCHGDAQRVHAFKQSPWQARTLGSQKKRRALAGADVANVCRTPGRQRKTFEAVFRQHTGKSRAIVEDGV